jgi:malonate transporter and related proteins
VNISGLVGSLIPVFFVLALGYLAGKRHTFDADQAAGLSKLALSFALPASLFVSTAGIPRDLLLQQGRLVLALVLAHLGLFIVSWIILRQVPSLRGTASIIYSLMLATSATPVFGLAVLEPILGTSSAGAVALVALTINLTVPLAVVLLEMDAATRNQQSGSDPASGNPVMQGIKGGLLSPLLWGPLLGMAMTLTGIRMPSVMASSLEMIGSATSGVAIFSVGLVLAGYQFRVSPVVLAGFLARIVVQSAVLFVLLRLLDVESPFSREALVCCSFPLATLVVLFAARYKSAQAETASMLLLSTLGLLITVPAMLWISR